MSEAKAASDFSDTPQVRALKEYRRRLEAKELKPLYVQLIATHKCNFRCPHCGTAAAEARPGELTTDEVMDVIDQLHELGADIFSLTGGEPILRPDFVQIMQRCKELGIKTGFVTNGFEVEERKDQIAAAEPFSVLVSIDGYRENHDKIRGMPGAYERAMKALETFKEIGVPVIGSATVMMPENVDDIPAIVDDCMAHGSMRHRVQTIVPEGRAVEMKNDREVMKRMMRYVYEARQAGKNVEVCEGHGYLGPLDGIVRPPFFCGAGWNTFTILCDGEVMGCPAMEFPEYSEGNVRNVKLADMWWNGFKRFREGHYDAQPQECKDCDDLEVCRGGCWLQMVNGDWCFIDVAREVAEEIRAERGKV